MAAEKLERLAGEVLSQVPAEVIAGERAVALYGMGFLGRWAAKSLPEAGIQVSSAFDGNSSLVGEDVEGIRVRPLTELGADNSGFVFITARHAVKAVRQRLDGLGVPNVSADAFFAARNLRQLLQLKDSLADDRSASVLHAVLENMMSGDCAALRAVFEKDQYFAVPEFCGVENEVYVDAGAYVGDSLERFVWTHYGAFERAIAFEPGARQYSALETRTRRLSAEWALESGKIQLVRAALGEKASTDTVASQSGELASSALGSGTERIHVVSLDDYLGGDRITFLKADVEGMEMPLLRGAATTIRKHRPKLAICVYHYPIDLLAVSLFLRSLVPEYRIALRHHSPRFLETVLYAWMP